MPPAYLARSIHVLLCSTLLQPSAIILALWYLTRLPVYFDWQSGDSGLSSAEVAFRKELLSESDIMQSPASEERRSSERIAPFRLAVLGCMLANKWLDDHTFSNKTW